MVKTLVMHIGRKLTETADIEVESDDVDISIYDVYKNKLKIIGRPVLNLKLYGENKPDWYSDALYRTKTGQLFLYGVGGPQSPFGKTIEGTNDRTKGSKIIPLTIEEALEWAKEHHNTDELMEVIDADKKDSAS